VKPKALPSTATANDGPAHEATVAYWVAEFEDAIEKGELSCGCGELLGIERAPDGDFIVCVGPCGRSFSLPPVGA
jgi:hypothetical protein